jgi:hypothetical protein
MTAASEMTNEELEARIEELDARIRPMLEMKPVEVYRTRGMSGCE